MEDNGTLLALHNLNEDKLRSALRLGGFPMPSIAVTRVDIPHTNFGDITLVMSRQTVDPRANRRNTVYSADAWTPTFPAIEYESDPQVERRISRRIGELSAQVDPFFRDDLRRIQYGQDDYLNRHGGEDGLVRWAMDNYGLKAAYLEEQGHHVTAATTQREADRGYDPERAPYYEAIADVLGTTDPETINSMNLKELRDKYGEALEQAYKAAAVAANLRVIAQQPTAILRALNTLDAKYLLEGTVKRGDWEKVMKYAPIARWKDWGYFDINTGRQMKDVLLGNSTRLEKLRQAGMAGAGKADSIAWARLWNAVEAETKDRRPGLKPGTDAFYRAVGERFSEIVDQTQVVDGILQRSQIMRSPDALTKISTSFMGEPTKSYNMFVNAVYDLRHATGKQARSRAEKALARTSTALVASFTINAIMQSIVDGLRDDDKELDYWEKVFQSFTGFTGDEETLLDYWNSFWSGNLEASYNPLAYMPYFKDLVSIAQGYDVTRMDMEAVEKVWTAFTNMRKALSGDGKYSIAGASANMMAEVARLLGLPVANLKRDVQAVATTAAIETDNYLMQYRMDKALLNIGYQGNRSNFMDILYAASVNDPEAYEIIYEDMVASGITEDQIKTAMESRMKEDQGVESVADLSRRYLTPNQERTYDRLHGQVSRSSVWQAASAEQRAAVEEDIYALTTGTDAGVKLQEKIDGGAAYGITDADYLLYLAAREIADGENEDPEKRNGSIDQTEAQAAIDMLTGLTDEGRAYLWQSTNKGWSEEKNPYR